VVDFVEICNIYVGRIIIKAAKRIFNSDKICRSYSDLNFGVTFLGHGVNRMLDSRGYKQFLKSVSVCMGLSEFIGFNISQFVYIVFLPISVWFLQCIM